MPQWYVEPSGTAFMAGWHVDRAWQDELDDRHIKEVWKQHHRIAAVDTTGQGWRAFQLKNQTRN